MSKKKIDNLFQEKLKTFDEIPDEKVWNAIEASLNKKKKSRKVIPIWWKLGGVAALLAIVLYVADPFSGEGEIETIVTDVEDTELPKTKENDSLKKDDFMISDENIEEVAASHSEHTDKKDNGDLTGKEASRIANTEERITDPSKIKEQKKTDFIDQKTENQKSGIAVTRTDPNLDKDVLEISHKKEVDVLGNNEKERVAAVENIKNDSDGAQEDRSFKEALKKEVSGETVLEESVTKEGIAEVKKPEEAAPTENNDKKSIFDEIKEQEYEDTVAKNDGSKWSVGPSVAPVYFDSFGEGSPIHSNFVPNSKSGNVNLSYGLSVSYDVSKRLSIRTGVHKVDYGYDTDEIAFSSSLDASTNSLIDNIDYNLASRNLVVTSKANRNTLQGPAQLDFAAEDPALDGRMVQQFGYLEIPVELNYALVDKKFGVNIIGGVSSLFLVDNSITLVSDGLITEAGEANNINNVNFSTNVGFGLNYKFSPKVQLNLEPVFKYQLNTFSETAGNFRPFSIGIYSGLNFKF